LRAATEFEIEALPSGNRIGFAIARAARGASLDGTFASPSNHKREKETW
jgi:hypothetical protein